MIGWPQTTQAGGQVGVTRGFSDGRRVLLGGLIFLLTAARSLDASAETIESALARAYAGNPTLNSTRASVRATDENVPRALSGYRPRVTGTADASAQYSEVHTPEVTRTNRGGDITISGGNTSISQGRVTTSPPAISISGPSVTRSQPRNEIARTAPRGAGLQIDQTLFNGFRTGNTTRQAESQVFGARESLRNTEQTILFNGAQAYMNVLRDTAILELQRNNVEVLEEQLRQTRDRFNVGEVTRTDVAQAEARLAASRSQVSLAESNLRTSGSSAVGSGILMLWLHGFDEAVGACWPQSRRADGSARHRIVAAAAGVCRSTQTGLAAHSSSSRSAQTSSRSRLGYAGAARRAPGA